MPFISIEFSVFKLLILRDEERIKKNIQAIFLIFFVLILLVSIEEAAERKKAYEADKIGSSFIYVHILPLNASVLEIFFNATPHPS